MSKKKKPFSYKLKKRIKGFEMPILTIIRKQLRDSVYLNLVEDLYFPTARQIEELLN